jgi:SAM-dependent methyltransferase
MDKKYWDNYYKEHGKDKDIVNCSTFAEFCLGRFFTKENLSIIELGSGNGRDAIYFAKHKINTIAIDQSTIAIDTEKENLDNEVNKYLHPKALDFVYEDYEKYNSIDVFYSRFTIHSITKDDEKLLLPKLYNSLNKDGLLCIEVRTTKDPLCGVGEFCGDNTYITDHKRRFIDSQEFLNKVLTLGFKLLYFTERNDLSIYKDDNPVLLRIILQK